MIKYILTSFVALLFFSEFTAQNDNLEAQIKKDPVFTEDIVDEVYGITYYEPYNIALNGDSVRLKRGYAVNGWLEDHYQNGKLLHKGFYIDGQLKIYKNFYPNGALEREFTNIDNFRSKATLYYDDGTIKSQVKYMEGYPKLWIDYYPNGKMEFYEEYNKNLQHLIAQRSYYDNGQPSSVLELLNKKKLTYSKTEYYEDGTIKMKGYMKYDKNLYDYVPMGTWVYYNPDGSELKEESYVDGKLKK